MTNKRKIAIKIMSASDKLHHVSPFLTNAWLSRKMAIQGRVIRKQAQAHMRAVKRKTSKFDTTTSLSKIIPTMR